jgi:hypothetical protein
LNQFYEYNEEFKETISIYIKYRYLDINKSENKSLITDTKINYKEIKSHLVKKTLKF